MNRPSYIYIFMRIYVTVTIKEKEALNLRGTKSGNVKRRKGEEEMI